jgi:hypothetical protein
LIGGRGQSKDLTALRVAKIRAWHDSSILFDSMLVGRVNSTSNKLRRWIDFIVALFLFD